MYFKKWDEVVWDEVVLKWKGYKVNGSQKTNDHAFRKMGFKDVIRIMYKAWVKSSTKYLRNFGFDSNQEEGMI